MSSSDDGYDYLYKFILVGDSNVGKTSFLSRFCTNKFNPELRPTIGIEFATRTIELEGKSIKLQVWDTAGQERYRAITSAYYRGAQGIILVYDITRQVSYYNIKQWLDEVENHASPDAKKFLVGNKSDLVDNRAITTDEAESFAYFLGIPLLETSALDSTNVDETFMRMAKDVLHGKTHKTEEQSQTTVRVVDPVEPEPKSKPVPKPSKPIPTVKIGQRVSVQPKQANECC